MFQKVISRAVPLTRAASTASARSAIPTLSQSVSSSTKTTQLDNGIRIITEASGAAQASIGVFVDAGSRYEQEGKNGVANLTEKLLVQGSKKRDQQTLAKDLAGLGSTLKAYTTRETTGLTLRVFPKDVQQGIDILGDVFSNVNDSNFAKAQAEAVKAIEASEARFQEVVFDKLHHTAFRGTSMGNPLLGTQESVSKLTAGDVHSYVDANFTGNRIVVAASGAVNHDELVNAVKSSLGSRAKSSAQASFTPAVVTPSDIMIRHDGLPEAHVAFGYAVPNANDDSFYTLQVMRLLLGKYQAGPNAFEGLNSGSSPIRQVAQEELAHSAQGFHLPYSDVGLFGTYATFGFTGQEHGMAALLRNMVRISYWVENSRLVEAKNQLKRELAEAFSCTDKNIQAIGKQALVFGRRIPLEEAFAKIDAVTEASVKDVATQFIQDQDHVLSALGPIYELPDYNWIRVRSFFRRF